jgi:hypothetical protein
MLAFLLFPFCVWAVSPPAEFRFRYVPAEDVSVACTHKQIRDLPDWEVFCGDKKFVAHVVVREAQREKQSTMEFLYWVTQRHLGRAPAFHSTTARMLFDGQAVPRRLVFEQGVENDAAALQLEWLHN